MAYVLKSPQVVLHWALVAHMASPQHGAVIERPLHKASYERRCTTLQAGSCADRLSLAFHTDAVYFRSLAVDIDKVAFKLDAQNLD